MSRFRLFGRPSSGPPPYPAPAHGAPPPLHAAWPGQPGVPSGWPAVTEDPPTDPYGFPPVPALEPVPLHTATAFPAAPAAALPAYPPTAYPPPAYPPPAYPVHIGAVPSRVPDPAEASSLAGAFAADYLSWDEDDPARRGRVLLDYLAAPGSDPARLGWSGRGRQRAEFSLPGLVRPDGEGRVLVDVRVRVTPYRSVGDHGPDVAADPEPVVAGVPAVAPAPTGRGWRSLASYWIRISVPVTTEGTRLIVDLAEETLGEEPTADPVRTADDHALADDAPPAAPPTPAPPAPPASPAPGGSW